MTIHSIAFDLDDTLLDTTGLLVPEATKQAYQVLINNGLQLNETECENFRLERIKSISHKDVFIELVQNYGTSETEKVLPLAIQTFYQPQLPQFLPLMPGAKENLDYLKSKYSLYLVTAGFEKGQHSKIEALGIKDYFEKIFIVDSLNKKRKFDAFQSILELNEIPADQLLCVGNSLSSEITDGLKIGALTCYFEFGEDRGDTPDSLKIKPHYHVNNHFDLIKTCRL